MLQRHLMQHTPKAGCEIRSSLQCQGKRGEQSEMDPESSMLQLHTAQPAAPSSSAACPELRGRMYRINKRTSHITICVAERTKEGRAEQMGTES